MRFYIYAYFGPESPKLGTDCTFILNAKDPFKTVTYRRLRKEGVKCPCIKSFKLERPNGLVLKEWDNPHYIEKHVEPVEKEGSYYDED